MLLGLLLAFAAALCYGVGSVLQAIAARSTEADEGLDPRLLVRLLRSWRYLLGVGLDGLGFLLSLVAVRTLPLFVVQAVVASFLAVTAILGALFLRMPLTRGDRIGLGVVVFGLALVAASAAEDRTVHVSAAEGWGVLVASVLLGVAAVPLGRLTGARGAAALGSVAGLAFGATAVASRMLPGDLSPDRIIGELGTLLTTPGDVRPRRGRRRRPAHLLDRSAARQRHPGDRAPGGLRDRRPCPGRPAAARGPRPPGLGMGRGRRASRSPSPARSVSPATARSRWPTPPRNDADPSLISDGSAF